MYLEIDSVNIYGQGKIFRRDIMGRKTFKIITRPSHILWVLRQLKTHEEKRPNFIIGGTATDLKILLKKQKKRFFDITLYPFLYKIVVKNI